MAFGNVVKYTVPTFHHVLFKCFVRSVSTSKFCACQMKFSGLPRTAYFQKKENEPNFSFSIRFEYTPLNIDRSFTVWRKVDSTISSFLTRVDLKITNYMEKKLKKSSSYDQKLPNTLTTLFKNGEEVSNDLLCASLFENEGEYAMKILDDYYDVVYNSPWIINMSLPKKIFTKSVIYPIKFEADFFDKERSSFKWYRSTKMAAYIKSSVVHVKDWVEVGHEYVYEVQDEDIGHYLMLVCIPQNETLTGPTFTTICAGPVVPTKDDYYFNKTHALTKEKVDESKIRIVSYNVLADRYACTKEAKTMFNYCPPEALEKSQRYAALTCEISGYNADIICLQEVDNSIYYDSLLGRLEHEGYCGVLCKKTIETPETACYYNKEKFNLISSEKYVFGKEIMVNPHLKNIHFFLKTYKDIMTKFQELPHSLQLIVLQPVFRQDYVLIVGNLHLFSQADADLLRLLQCIASFQIYEYAVNKLKEERPNDKMVFVLCGDFNSTPECSINELVMNGSISPEHPIWSSEKVKGFSYTLPLSMDTAFPDVKYTNYTRLFKGCLDYIYYQSDSLEMCKTYPFPSVLELNKDIGLPSFHFPSDHLPLIAELKWKV